MGLDIYAYHGLNFISKEIPDEEIPKGQIYIWINERIPNHAERAWDLRKGIYSYSGARFTFRAGSYSGYNDWRGLLANMIGKTDVDIWTNPVPGPFMELINFSDCDGAIGPAVSRKLYKDFRDHYQDAKALKDDGGWFLQQYCLWMKAFSIASKAGVVDFS